MNYPETIDYLYNKLPLFSRLGSAAYKKDLTNIRLLCENLEQPQNKFPTIHVAGTNGKGSVSHMLAAVLQTAGYKTGLYTSPHLYDFRERIKVNGEMADQAFIVDFTEKIQPLIETLEPSFFEITVAMAFAYFALQNVDVAVIEVGLGGRLDSTNIIIPEVSVITNIGWDHMNMLGETLPEIAREKGGIIKPGIPVVIGEVLEETKPVFEQLAEQNHAPLFYAEAAFEAEAPQWKEGHLYVEVMKKNSLKKDLYELDLPGIYQKKNLCTVLATIEVLRNRSFEISDRELVQGLQNTQLLTGLSGRWELIHRDPMIILEVAHNKNGMEQMLQHLQHISFGKLHLILGMVKDKDLDQVLSLLPANAQYYFTQAQIPRALPAPELQQKAARFSLEGVVCGEVNQALEKALAAADPADLILICGSIFLVAEVRRPA